MIIDQDGRRIKGMPTRGKSLMSLKFLQEGSFKVDVFEEATSHAREKVKDPEWRVV